MKERRLAALGLVLATAAFGVGCDADGDAAEESIPATEELEQPSAQPGGAMVLTGEFEEPEGAAGDVDGEFELRTESADAGTLVVQLEGLTPGEHAWHIHEGDCANVGQIVIALTPMGEQQAIAGAQALVAGADGKVTTTVNLTRAELDRLHVGFTEATGAAPEPGAGPGLATSSPEQTGITGARPNEPAAGSQPRAGRSESPAQADGTAKGTTAKFSINVHQQAGANPGPPAACATMDVRAAHGDAAKALPLY